MTFSDFVTIRARLSDRQVLWTWESLVRYTREVWRETRTTDERRMGAGCLHRLAQIILCVRKPSRYSETDETQI